MVLMPWFIAELRGQVSDMAAAVGAACLKCFCIVLKLSHICSCSGTFNMTNHNYLHHSGMLTVICSSVNLGFM
jgi:hypothetical protein